MNSWTQRESVAAGVTFLCIGDEDFFLLAPPGHAGSLRRSTPDRSGVGLWLLASWSLNEDEPPLVDFDPPNDAWSLRTQEALLALGEDWREAVAELMRSQLEQTWALNSPSPFHELRQRATLELSPLLTELHDEIREAFPADGFWSPRWPIDHEVDEVELSAWLTPMSSRGCPYCHAEEPPVRVRDLLRAVRLALRMKVSQRPGPRPSDLYFVTHHCREAVQMVAPTPVPTLNEEPRADPRGVTNA